MANLFGGLFSDHNAPQTIEETTSAAPAVNQAAQDQNLVSNKVDPIKAQDMAALSHLDPRSTQVISRSYEETKKIKQALIEPDQLFLALISDREIFKLLQEFSVDAAKLTREIQSRNQTGNFTNEPTLSEQVKQILEESYANAKKREVEFVSPEDILLVFFNKETETTRELKAQGLQKEKVEEKLSKNTEFKTGKKSVLSEFGTDLTQKAKEGKLDPVTGRDREVERMVHILLRRTKNNPIVIGEAGTGKTAIVEGLAQMIADNKVSPDLASKKIIQLEISSLVAGASHRGEFEERLQSVIKEVMASNGQIILFIDEIHTLLGAGGNEGALDASNIVKPYLARGQIQIIGATTTSEYRKYFEKDRAFERRFQPIVCDEPSEEVALQMIKVLQPKYETFHKVKLSEEAMQQAVHLSKRYIGERYLPDKAIDLLDESAAEVKLSRDSGKRSDATVTGEDIQNVVSRSTGIPISKLTEKESEKLLHLEDLIHKKFVNHERAVKAVAEAVRRGRIGLANANRPIASFIFLGPTGTGKTELAKNLAEIMFGRPDAMVRLDMSEYMEKHEVAKLVGAPPGYVGYEEGGQLTEAVRAKPYSIVLLDEIEKAHPDVFNILLQLLEDGRLTDNKGNTISFKNTVVIATSNIASDLIRQKIAEVNTPQTIQQTASPKNTSPSSQVLAPATATQINAGVQTQPSLMSNPAAQPASPQTPDDKKTAVYKQLQKLVMEQLTKHFRPELINRFDEVVFFEPLTEENMMIIAQLGIDGVKKMLKEQNIDLQISQTALRQLAKEGYDPQYGARPLRRLIQRSIENPIAIYLIQKTIVQGDTILVDYDPSKDQYIFQKAQPTPVQNPALQTNGSLQPGNGAPAPNTNGQSQLSQNPPAQNPAQQPPQ